MAFPVDGGYGTGYSASAAGSMFIPEIWSGKLLVKFYPATVFGAICNTDYEGEISGMGDKVYIRTTPDTTIRSYSIGASLTTEKLTSTPVELLIDKGKYFAFVIDDVDKYQSDLALVEDWSQDAAEQMKISIDTDLLAETTGIQGLADAANQGGTAGAITGAINLGTGAAPLSVTTSTIMDVIVDLGVVLDEQNVPESDRWLVIPARLGGYIKKSDLRDASLAGDGTSIFRNGRIGMVDRFTVYVSNNLPADVDAGTNFVAYAGHPKAISFAAQMTNMETLRAESTFGDVVRGLNVYGFKVTKPEALAELKFTYG
jgi:hypothetical protein